MDFNSIDWNALWQAESKQGPWRNHLSAKELWDKQADSFDKRINRVKEGEDGRDKDDYISKMLERIETHSDWTVLDIGCGPGTLTIPLAKKVKSVTALDISSNMLKHLQVNAEKNGIQNFQTVNSAWEDALTDKKVGMHDVVVASRSVTPVGIKDTLNKLDSVAGKAVYLTLPVIHLPFDWEVYQAIGRGNKKHPSYIYVYNTLYQMGIQANVEILRCRVNVQFASIEDAMSDLQWRTDPFSSLEKEKLVKYLTGKFAEQKDSPVFIHRGYSKWALIWWKKE